MEGKGGVIEFRAIYSKRSPSGSLARARYIHQPYRGYKSETPPSRRTCVHLLSRDFESQFRGGGGGTQTPPCAEFRTGQEEPITLPARQRGLGCSARNESGEGLGGGGPRSGSTPAGRTVGVSWVVFFYSSGLRMV